MNCPPPRGPYSDDATPRRVFDDPVALARTARVFLAARARRLAAERLSATLQPTAVEGKGGKT